MEKQIQFNNDWGEKLSATLHQPDMPTTQGIIIGHCFTCSRHTRILQRLGNDLALAQFSVLRFDFSGNGQSEGSFIDASYSKHIAEMKSAMAHMHASGIRWFGLAGHSMGAHIALLTAAHVKKVKALCLLAGRLSGLKAPHFLNDKQQAEISRAGRTSFTSRGRLLEISNKFFSDANRYDLLEAARTLNRPMLVIHGDQDEIVPVSEARKAHRVNPDAVTLSIVPGADHMFSHSEHRERIAALAAEWFSRQRSPRNKKN